MMKLIVESTSNRTEWALVDGKFLIQKIITDGINPFFQGRREISRSVRLNLPVNFFRRKISQIYYYGVGCYTAKMQATVEASLVAQFRTAIQVESNMLGAARGLFKTDKGIACILGMDSNSCLYDGENIVKNVCPGGYVLGDEGSEIVLGKMFIADFVKDITPYVLSASFIDQFGLTMEDILQIIYNEPNPTALLSKAARFLWEHLENEYVQDLVVNNIRDFFRRNICLYDYKDYKIRFVGSTAVNYSGFLKQVAAEFDAEVDIIQESSIPGLIEYYELMSGLPK